MQSKVPMQSFYHLSIITLACSYFFTKVIGTNQRLSRDSNNNPDFCPVLNLTCKPTSFDKAILAWTTPANENASNIIFIILDKSTNQTFNTTELSTEHFSPVPHLYQVKAYSNQCFASGHDNISIEVICAPYKPLSIINVTSTTITLNWTTSASHLIDGYAIYWAESIIGGTWTKSLSLSSLSFSDTITDLKPDTGYEFALEEKYITPPGGTTRHNPIVARTRIDAPVSPENVTVIKNSGGDSLYWNAAPLNEQSTILYYTIEYRNRSKPNSPHVVYGDWMKKCFLGLEHNWTIRGLPFDQWYEFRVYATNMIGRGDSSLKAIHFLNTPQAPAPVTDLRLAVGLSVSLTLVAIIALTIGIKRWRNRRRIRKGLKNFTSNLGMLEVDYGNDIELASIRHMTSLALAAGNVNGFVRLPPGYRDQLVVFTRDKLVLGEPLGSGAFGEVYRGTARVAKTDDGEEELLPVAIKTLKETASDNEKHEFLMECYFMSLFDHRNIISSIGVCIENESPLLVLELMEGGDLLNYLRGARETDTQLPKLSIIDILDMSLDLAAGCSYLEKKNFIHRDLAARNCLVSTSQYQGVARSVKVGDFGLARDLHENDYYLKEGHGLVPVRWMAPESISLQKYTAKSDVWSFGVVLWEMCTFGQRPYAVYNNDEVVARLKRGERLSQPQDYCPDQLYDVMKQCWRREANDRPSFEDLHVLLKVLEHFLNARLSENVVDLIVVTQENMKRNFASTRLLPPSFRGTGDALDDLQGNVNLAFSFDDGLVSDASDISSNPTSFYQPENLLSLCDQQRKTLEMVPKEVAGSVNYATLHDPSNDDSAARIEPTDLDETTPKSPGTRLSSKSRNTYVTSPVRTTSVNYTPMQFGDDEEKMDENHRSIRRRQV